MGLFDSLKNVFGGKSDGEADVTISPSQMLRDAGVDPSRLKMSFGSDGSIAVSGQIDDESERQTIIDTLSGAAGISRVDDQMSVAPPEPVDVPVAAEEAVGGAEGTSEPAAIDAVEVEAPAAAEEPVVGWRKYTVQSGDTLWKVAEEMYGNGSKYMKIFEANTDLLEHPDKIFPGQKLTIPDLDD